MTAGAGTVTSMAGGDDHDHIDDAERFIAELEAALTTVELRDEGADAGPPGGMAGEVWRLLEADGIDPTDEGAVLDWFARFSADVDAGRRPSVAQSWHSARLVLPPALDERAPGPDPAKLPLISALLDELDVPEAHRARAEAVGAELLRVCDAVLDGHYLIDSVSALVALTLITDSGIHDGAADEWAGGILVAIGQDQGLGDPAEEPYIPAAQLARIVGVAAPDLQARADRLRAVLAGG